MIKYLFLLTIAVPVFANEYLEHRACKAIETKNYAMFQQYLSRGINPDALCPGPLQLSLLSLASQSNCKDCAESLLDAKALVNLPNSYGFTALMSAAQAGQAEIVRLLIQRGASVDLQDNNGTTALMLAAQAGQVEAVRLLIEKGASLSLKNSNGITALKFAERNFHEKTAELLKLAEVSAEL
jgi:ankyrin repeat protein